ncbi:DNA-3-methyladenine glycosylase [Sphingomonas colocasiae]|nr:DNA-3-methyladenine glycosylase [Sphingomonas colocasiae]
MMKTAEGLGAKITGDFFERDVETVAHDLVGVSVLVDGVGGTIVETEAYAPNDPAAHSYNGPTLRNAAMFGPADRAGIMWSDAPPHEQDGDHAARDLHAALIAAHIDGPLVLIGHSLGGPYIMNYTRQFGSNAKGLVFVDASHPDQIRKLAAPGTTPKPPELPAFMYLLAKLSWTGAARLIDLPGDPDESTAVTAARNAYLGHSIKGAVAEISALETTLAQGGRLRSLGDRPLVVLTAMKPYSAGALAEENLTASQGAARQQRWLQLHRDEASWSSRSRHESLSDAGHYIQNDRPDAVIRAASGRSSKPCARQPISRKVIPLVERPARGESARVPPIQSSEQSMNADAHRQTGWGVSTDNPPGACADGPAFPGDRMPLKSTTGLERLLVLSFQSMITRSRSAAPISARPHLQATAVDMASAKALRPSVTQNDPPGQRSISSPPMAGPDALPANRSPPQTAATLPPGPILTASSIT